MTLHLENVSVALGKRTFRFSLSASAGEVHAILGKSGSGKSTLLNLIGGFLKPSSGHMTWQEQNLIPLAPEDRPITTLFQAHNLFDHLSVRKNVALGISAKLKLNPSGWQAVDEVLKDVGLNGRGEALPEKLSGGEQQRVGLARSLLRNRPILLLDEPFGALDETTRSDMLALTQTVISKNHLCVLMVTHNPDDADALQATRHTIENAQLG